MNLKRMINTQRILRVVLIGLLSLLIAPGLMAHAPQENYVWLNVEDSAISGRFELNIKDVNDKLGIDVDAAGETRDAGVKATAAAVQDYLRTNFSLVDSAGEIEYEFLEPGVFVEGNAFLQYPFETTRLPVDNNLTVNNSVWVTPDYLKSDILHRSVLVMEHNKSLDKEFGEGNVATVFGPKKLSQEIDLANPGTILEWKDFLYQGVLHIAIGWDHILFILVLLLTVVVRYENGKWVPVDGFKTAFINTLKIVTLFTIAHSITLSLAALGLINMPDALVESVIAFSILAVALNNIFPRFAAHSWILVFCFGLFHGLGFATVMQDLPFRNGFIERILVMFNVGVEVGQLAIVAVAFPILYWLRKQKFYHLAVVSSVSVVAIMVSAYWIAERTGMI